MEGAEAAIELLGETKPRPNPRGVLRYRREELLELHAAVQEGWWTDLLGNLGPEVAEELVEIQAVPDVSHLRRRSKNSERRQRSKAKREALHAVSVNSFELVGDGQREYEHDNFHPGSGWRKANENTGGRSHPGKGFRKHRDYHDEDNEEPESFQPRAFAVEGEPNFESGPPQDGWEYLRRVKHEAAQCPKVMVAEIDPTKLLSEQTQYMPELQEIPACPPDVLPSKVWEGQFLADFSLLRMALSNICFPPTSASDRVPPVRNNASWEVRCFGSISSTTNEDCQEHINEGKEKDTSVEQDPVPPSGESFDGKGDCRTREEVTNGTAEDACGRDGVTEAEEVPVPFCGSSKGDCLTSKCQSDPDIGVVSAELCELIQAKLDHSCDPEPQETNYVIDLSTLSPWTANVELEGSYDVIQTESEYLISGEPFDALDYLEIMESPGLLHTTTEFESEQVPCANVLDNGNVAGVYSSIAVEIHRDNETDRDAVVGHDGTEASPSHFSSDFDQLTTSNWKDSVGGKAPAMGHVDLKDSGSCRIVEFDHFQRKESADEGDHMEGMSTSYVEALDENQLTEFPDLLCGLGETFDHVEFEDLCGGLEYQFEFLTIGENDVAQEEMDRISPFCYPESAEMVDLEAELLATTDFMDSFVGLEVFNSGKIVCNESFNEAGSNGVFKLEGNVEQLMDKVFQLVGVSQLPFINLLLRMDEVSRAALFRFHVSWLENFSGLSQDRALWLLALSAVVDTPLNAETSAAFRGLLRHCAQIRSCRQGGNDEDVYMLNALSAVAGSYFGQAEGISSKLLYELQISGYPRLT